MTNQTKNTLLVGMVVVTIAALFYAFQSKAPQSSMMKKTGMTLEQAGQIKSNLESSKTDKEKLTLLQSQFGAATVSSKSNVGLNVSSAKTDWCKYANYYLGRATSGVSNEMRQAYLQAAIAMYNNANWNGSGNECDGKLDFNSNWMHDQVDSGSGEAEVTE